MSSTLSADNFPSYVKTEIGDQAENVGDSAEKKQMQFDLENQNGLPLGSGKIKDYTQYIVPTEDAYSVTKPLLLIKEEPIEWVNDISMVLFDGEQSDIDEQKQEDKSSEIAESGNEMEDNHEKDVGLLDILQSEDEDIDNGIMESNVNNLTPATNSGDGSKTKDYVCEHCLLSYSAKKNLYRHMRVAHEMQRLTCEYCDKVFSYKQSLKEHITAAHLKDRPFPCKLCNYVGARQRDLKAHESNIHGNRVKPFMCHHCDYRCTRVVHLLAHIAGVHEKKRKEYSCDQCDEKFTRKLDAKRHVHLVHEMTFKEEYSCNQCEQTFKDKSRVNEHMANVHEKQRRFSCQLCNYTSYYSSNMKRHVRIHDIQNEIHEIKIHVENVATIKETKRLFSCDLCTYTSTYTSNLKRHFLTHQIKDKFMILGDVQ